MTAKHIVTSTEALCFDRVPEHLLVVGGGYIGLELGSVWSRLGSKVTVVEFLPRILPLTDGEMATLLHKMLAKESMTFQLDTKVTGAEVKNGRSRSTASSKGSNLTLTADKVLVAVGRRPNSANLGLKEARSCIRRTDSARITGERAFRNQCARDVMPSAI